MNFALVVVVVAVLVHDVAASAVSTTSTGAELTSQSILPPPPGHTGCNDPVQDGDYQVISCKAAVFITADTVSLKLAGVDKISHDRAVVVRAQTVTIDVNVSPKHLYIYAINLHYSPGVIIDVSGRLKCAPVMTPSTPGTLGANGIAGSDGSAGPSGGNVVLVTKEFAYDATQPLIIKTNGADGCPGMNGGNGASGRPGSPSPSCDTNGGPGGSGGNGGEPGSGGNGGSGGHVYVVSENPLVPTALRMSFGPGGPGKQGAPGHPGVGGIGGARHCRDWHTGCCLWKHHHHCCSSDGPHGATGHQAPPPKHIPTMGRTGNFTFQSFNTTNVVILTPLAATFAMDQADAAYRNGDVASARDQYLALLSVIRHSSAPQPPVNSSVVAPRASGARALSSMSSSPGSVEMLSLIANRTASQLAKIKQGVDYFGTPPMHCPSLSVDYYSRSVEQRMGYAQTMEVQWHVLQQKTSSDLQQRTALNAGITTQTAIIAQLEAKAEAAIKKATELSNIANRMQLAIEYAKRNITHDEQSCVHEIEEKLAKGQFFHDLIVLVETVVDVTDFTKLAGDLTNLVKTGESIAHDVFHGDFGDTFVKDWGSLVGDLKSAGDSVEKLWKHYETYKNFVQSLADRDHSKRLVIPAAIEKMIKKYTDLPACQHLQDDFHHLFSLIRTRNGVVVQHDQHYLSAAHMQASARLHAKKKEMAQHALIGTFDPTLFDAERYMAHLYEHSKDMVAADLFEYHQAYTCNSLETSRLTIPTTNVAALTFAKEQIDSNVQRTMEYWSGTGALWSYSDSTIFFNNPRTIHSLRKNGFFNVTVNLAHEALAGFSHVQMTDFRFVLPGIQTANGIVKLRVTRPGFSLNRDQYGRIWRFTVPPKTHMLATDHSGRLLNRENLVSDDLMRDVATNLAYRSPFSVMLVEVPRELNPGLDLSNVNVIELHLSGNGLAQQVSNAKVPFALGGTSNDTIQPCCHPDGTCVGYTKAEPNHSPVVSTHDTKHALVWGLSVGSGCLVLFAGVAIVVRRRRRLAAASGATRSGYLSVD